MLYHKEVNGYDQNEKIKIVEAADRVQLFINHKWSATQYQETLGKDLEVYLEKHNSIDILVENMGRVNYGYKLVAPTQRKGIRSGVRVDIHFESGWDQYALDFADIKNLDFSKDGKKAFRLFMNLNGKLWNVWIHFWTAAGLEKAWPL